MYWLYKPAISLYFYAIRIAAFFRNDAKKWVDGRIGWRIKLQAFINSIEHKDAQKIWIHASSLGEFEQGRELIHIIRTNHPDKILILSFFSPSGYDACKHYSAVNYVCYFPSDVYRDIQFFIKTINPSLAIIVKYEFWFNTLELLHKNKIPCCFISAIFRERHFIFQPIFHSLLKKLKSVEHIFLQDENSFNLLSKWGFEKIQIAGDTRLDRVFRISNENTDVPGLEFFCDRNRIFIAGSIWEIDLEIINKSLVQAIVDGWKIILVPHVTDEHTIQQIELRFPGQTIRFSRISETVSEPILIVDQIGYLSKLYHVCLFAYVGGGFGKGIHNILEPASHLKAVCFGPNHQKFQEAKEFIDLGIAYEINQGADLENLFHKIPEKQEIIKAIVADYFQRNLGASQKIYQYLVRQQLL